MKEVSDRSHLGVGRLAGNGRGAGCLPDLVAHVLFLAHECQPSVSGAALQVLALMECDRHMEAMALLREGARSRQALEQSISSFMSKGTPMLLLEGAGMDWGKLQECCPG